MTQKVIEYFSLITACSHRKNCTKLFGFLKYFDFECSFFSLGVLKKSKESILAKLKNATLFEVASSICVVMVPLFFTLLPFSMQ